MSLKEILDKFGWDKVQQGQLPPEIKPERGNLVGGVHTYALYGLNGVCIITEDEKKIIELFGLSKTDSGYRRTAQTPQNTVVSVENIDDFLRGFKRLHGFRNAFVYVKEENMHFGGIGKRLEEAGELYKP